MLTHFTVSDVRCAGGNTGETEIKSAFWRVLYYGISGTMSKFKIFSFGKSLLVFVVACVTKSAMDKETLEKS